jgi:hypothetical protein
VGVAHGEAFGDPGVRVSESLCLVHNLKEKENDQREAGDEVRRLIDAPFGEAWDQSEKRCLERTDSLRSKEARC